MADVTQEELERWWVSNSGYREELLEAAQATPGHTGAMVRYADHELVLFGLGQPPAELAAVIDRASVDFHVRWQEAPYSRAELLREVRRLLSTHRGLLTSGGPRHDGTRLELTTMDPGLVSSPDPQALLGSRYPVSVGYGEPAVAALG